MNQHSCVARRFLAHNLSLIHIFSLHLPQGQRVQAQLLDIAEDGGLLIAREGRQEVLYSGDIFPVGQQ